MYLSIPFKNIGDKNKFALEKSSNLGEYLGFGYSMMLACID